MLWRSCPAPNVGGDPFNIHQQAVDKELRKHFSLSDKDIRTAAALPVVVRFPYPTGGHCDDACDWSRDDAHRSELVEQRAGHALIRRTLDAATYYVVLDFEGAELAQTGRNRFVLTPTADRYTLRAGFYDTMPAEAQPDTETAVAADRKSTRLNSSH